MDDGSFSFSTPFTPPTTEEDELVRLRLIRSRRVGPATFWRLIGEHGNAAAAFAALPGVARDAGVENYMPCPESVARAELSAGRRAGARLVHAGGPGYPARLLTLPDPPPLLWCLGRSDLSTRPMVALVGARNASSLGLRMARRLAQGLAEAGHVVVSGLARGIDAAAHDAALAGGTVAVQAGGIDILYPAENAALAAAIAERGLRLSEQRPGLEPQARHFPQRNRIIAGLAEAVVVVEAAPRSGSLITARDALDLGREVMAVPGHPVDARAGGCNQLIRDGAVLVRGIEDVIEALTAGGTRGLPLRNGTAPQPRAEEPVSPRADADRRPPGTPPSADADADSDAGENAARTPAKKPPGTSRGASSGPSDQAADRRSLAETAALHSQILDRLAAAPLAEDQLIRDLALPASALAPELLTLELEGRVLRAPGGLLSRLN
ncbi:DNA-processing protein DprA [Frigidibacter oleivorans]|uniref:DNA-processing protein DprA n=1 Tax=Frigidibacter oleivorans TaxID=2487129 RepID=UPI000F8E21A5|nr:DNA-processing protein DprA [Frigidibacter oleivorans]